MDKTNGLALKLLLVSGGLIIGCLIAEIGLRVAGYSHPIFFKSDSIRGYTLLPNVRGWSWEEIKNYFQTNSEGLRDREHSKAKPADTIRIVVLGDSFAEARQVPQEQTFWAVMEQRLQGCRAFAGKKVEVINLGVSGYGTAQELLTLRQRGWDYSPDIVLLTVTIGNDITDNYRPFKRSEAIPYFLYRDGKLVYDASFRDSSVYRRHDSNLFSFWVWLHNRSRSLQLLHHAQDSVRRRISTWKEQKRISRLPRAQDRIPAAQHGSERTASANDVGLNNLIYLEPADNDWNEAWGITERLIVQMRDEVKQRGVGFLVAAIGSDIQVYPDKSVRQAFMRRVGVDHLFYPDLRLQALANHEGIAFLDLAQPMQAYADQNRVFFHGFGKELGNGHWNATGHRVAGELMAQKLCEGNSH